MSTTIDKKVVEMQFNNSNFESNVKTSMNTLEKLKEALNFSGVSDSFDSITSSADKVDLSGLSGAVQTVSEKFSALEVVAISALATITNQAIQAGEQLIASLSIDNISAGWEKFASKTTSVGTLISQGYDMETVTEQLERLNWYTDETSYNFTDMVSNIAKFTASGQDLETSVTAMEGIANWAALSGQNATTASQAMYQLAQAMSAGYMRLEDYRSIQNASMDTEEFRQKCLDAAVTLGTLQENADGTYTSIVDGASSTTFTLSSFTTGLTEGCWLTSDVMMNVFNDYANAVDQIYEYAEENGVTASEAIEALGDSVDEFGLKAFKAAQEARTWTDVIDSVKDAVSTGWMNTFELIFGNYEEATELWTDLANALYDVFAAGAEDRNALLETWKDLGGRDVLIESFWTAWNNLGEILGTVKEAFQEVFPSVTAEQLYSLTEGLQNFVEKLKMSDENLANLKNTFKGIFSVIDIVRQVIVALFNGVTSLLGGTGDLAGGIFSLTGSFGEWLTSIDEAIKESDIFNTTIQTIVDHIKKAISAIGDFVDAIVDWENLPDLSTIISSVKEFIETVEDTVSSVLGLKKSTTESFEEMDDTVSNSVLVGVFTTLWNVITTVASVIKNTLTKAIEGLISVASNVDLNSVFSVMKELLTGGILASVIELLHNFASGLGDISDFVSKLEKGAVNVLNSFGSVLQSWSTSIKADTILKIAAAVGILAIALIALTAVDTDKLGTAIAAISALCVDLVAAMTALQKLTGSNSTSPLNAITNFMDSMSNSKQYSNMIKVAAAIAILAASLTLLASADQGNLASSFATISGLFVDIVAAMAILNKLDGKTSGLTTMIGLAAAILILSSAVKSLSELKWDELAKGLVSVAVLCAELTAAMIALNQFGGKTSGAVTMIAMAAALKIMASACQSFATMSWDEIARGLTAMAGALAELVIALNLATGTLGASAALLVASAALEVLANVFGKMSGFSWTEIATGLVAMGGALAELVVALNLMTGTLAGSAALLVAAVAIDLLTPALKALGNMSITQVATALITLAGAFTIIGVAAAVLSPLTATILALAASFTLIGVGVAAVGAGLVAAGVGITAIATGIVSLATSVAVGGSSIISGIEAIIVSIISFIPDILIAIGEGIVGICDIIAEGAPTIAAAVVAVISSILSLLVETVPQFVETVAVLLSSILSTLVEYAPLIIQNVLALLVACLTTIANNLGSVIASAVSVVLAFISGIIQQIPVVVDAAFQMIVAFINGLADAIEQNTPLLVEAVQNLFVAIIDAAITILFGAVDTFIEAGGTIISGFVEGILGAIGTVGNAIASVASSVVGGFSDLLGINSPADATIDLGEYTSEGLAVGLENGENTVVEATESVGNSLVESLSDSLSGVSDLGSDTITELINGISSSSLDLSSVTADTIDSSVLTTMTESLSSTTEIGSDSITDLITGITSQSADLSATTTETIESGVITPMTETLSTTAEIGSTAIEYLISGMTSQSENLSITVTSLGSDCVITLQSFYSEFESAGAYLVEGFAAGITENTFLAEAQASAMASAAADAARAALDINSPSKVGSEIGNYFGLGFVNAIGDYDETAYDASADMANSAKNGLSTIDGSMPALTDSLSRTTEIGSEFIAGLISGITSQSSELNSVVTEIMDKDVLDPMIETLASTGTIGSECIKNLISGMELRAEDLNAASTTLAESMRESYSDFESAGSYLVEGLVSGITENASQTTAFEDIVGDYVSTLREYYSDFESAGSYLIKGFTSGLTEQSSQTTTFKNIASNAVSTLKGYRSDFESAGSYLIEGFVAGITDNTSQTTTFENIVSDYISTLRGYYSDFESAGSYLIEGFIAGMTEDPIFESSVGTAANDFSQALIDLAETGIADFIATFEASAESVTLAVDSLLLACIATIDLKKSNFLAAGAGLLSSEGLYGGLLSKRDNLLTFFTNMLNSSLTIIVSYYPNFYDNGVTTMSYFISGVSSESESAIAAFGDIATTSVETLRGYYSEFESAGAYLVEGFAAGITENTFMAEAQAAAMASAAAAAARAALSINSPSKVGYEIGDYFGLGFVNAIRDYGDIAYDTSADMANSAKNGLTTAISQIADIVSGDLDMEPTIRPVLDLSDVEKGAGTISTLFNRSHALTISAGMNRDNSAEIQNGENIASGKSGNTYQFIQTNNSPKALSRTEIYRQTRNQFSGFERMVEA